MKFKYVFSLILALSLTISVTSAAEIKPVKQPKGTVKPQQDPGDGW
jgi:hypothetical protein